jgi:alanyl aminopeptidase
MQRTGLVTLAVTMLACSGEPLPPVAKPALSASVAPTAAATAQAPAPTPPAFRLSAAVTPRKVTATLTLVPAEDSFRGAVEIDLVVAQPARVIWLNASDLSVTEAHLDVNGAARPARIVPGGDHFVGFAFDEDVPAGPARLSASYAGKVSGSDDRGVFREKEGSDVFLFSQFENIEARRAFPCFDEPSFKVPWQLTLRVKPTDVALSNTPITSEKTDADGFKTVRFAETKPLPSYLVAFAVGPFEMVDAGTAGKNKTPIRLAIPPGKRAEVAYAAGAAPKIFDLLEDAFGVPYPYEKLDFVAIPHLASFGAMENAGLITVAAYALLATPAEDTARFRNGSALYIAHEAAHQWFGDLVTMAWWDDVWLNEGFATWMEGKITHRFDPTFGADVAAVASRGNVMGQDGLLSARKVRQEVVSNDDIANAFDGITYQKGGAVLDMFEAWLGPAAFQKGVKLYLERNTHKNATSNDFLAALGEGAGKDVKAAMSTFLDQPGVPIVTAKLACNATAAKLQLAQERYLPTGSKGSSAGSSWQIPVCVRYGAGKQSGRACTLLAAQTGELALPALEGQKSPCPDWVLPKSEGHGYYRSAFTPRDVETLLDKKKAPLSAGERLSVVHDVRSLAANGRLPIGDALARLPDLLKDPSAYVQSAASDMAFWLSDKMVEPALRPNVRRFVNKVVAPRARALGWQAKAADTSEVRRLRYGLLDVMIDLGDDAKLMAEAQVLAGKWLDDPKAVDPESVEQVLHAAVSRGDQKLYDRIAGLAKTEKDTRRREKLITALAGFRDPAIVKASLALFLDSASDPRQVMSLIWGQQDTSLPVLWDFVKEHFDAVMARVPTEVRPYVLGMPGGFCDEAHRADLESFMKDHAAKVTGAPRAVAQALESISLCIAQRDQRKESLSKFLEKQ